MSLIEGEQLGELLRRARHVAVLTGAGISAESGIPTFREAMTGLWAQFDPEALATPHAFARQPSRVWDWYAERRRKIGTAAPNPGHYALVTIEQAVPEFTLITQNIDGLHAAAGSRNVVELHGNIGRVKCSREGTPVEQWDATQSPPHCQSCGAPLRPDVVWFGELLPDDATSRAWEATAHCDVFLSVGTSNLVWPAASLPWTAHGHGAHVIVANTTMEGQRRGERIHHLLGPSGETLPRLVREAWPSAVSRYS